MSRLRGWAARIRGLLTDARRDDELCEELAHIVQEHVDDLRRSGVEDVEARRRAALEVGGVERLREIGRDARGIPALEHLSRDVRFAARSLAARPGFTAVAVLTLGLGIGVNTAMFSVINAVLLRPLPYSDPSRLVLVQGASARTSARWDVMSVVSYPNFDDWRRESRTLASLAAFTIRTATLSGDGAAERVSSIQATGQFFSTLGVAPLLGRTFADQEPGVAVLSHDTWQHRYGGRVDVLGQRVVVNETPRTIVGVMPEGFSVARGAPEDFYLPLVPDTNRDHHYLRVIARLADAASLGDARAEMGAIVERLARHQPDANRGLVADVTPLAELFVGDIRPSLLVVAAIVAIVLLMACANVANLLLARGHARRHELRLRAALGATRARLVQQLLVESALLSIVGGAGGLALAVWASRTLVWMLSTDFDIPRLATTSVDGRVLAFTFGVSLASGLAFGSLHALTAVSPGLERRVRETGLRAAPRASGAPAILVVVETALALVLTAGAGSLVKTLAIMRSTSIGFIAEHVVSSAVSMPSTRYSSWQARSAYLDELVRAVAERPGVAAAATVMNLPMSGNINMLGFIVPGRTGPEPEGSFNARLNVVSDRYFETLRIPLRSGRSFDARDADAGLVAVINDAAAKQLWPGLDPLGRTIVFPGSGSSPLTVVGVVGDVHQDAFDAAPEAEVYLSTRQPTENWLQVTLLARATGDTSRTAAQVFDAARSVDRFVVIGQPRLLTSVLADTLARPTVFGWLLSVFALLGVVLAAVGLHGVVAHGASQRTRELGIRRVLGAAPSLVLWLVLRQGFGLSVAGIAIGSVFAFSLVGLTRTLLPNVEPHDPLVLGGVSTLLLVVSLAASAVPAIRASRVDPAVVLREEV